MYLTYVFVLAMHFHLAQSQELPAIPRISGVGSPGQSKNTVIGTT